MCARACCCRDDFDFSARKRIMLADQNAVNRRLRDLQDMTAGHGLARWQRQVPQEAPLFPAFAMGSYLARTTRWWLPMRASRPTVSKPFWKNYKAAHIQEYGYAIPERRVRDRSIADCKSLRVVHAAPLQALRRAALAARKDRSA